MPSGSYFAEGLVMTSTRSMELAGICSKNAFCEAPLSPEGRPSMRICTWDEPLSETFPSISTVTEGTFTSNSLAVPPAADRSFPTRNTRRSINISRELSSAMTSASSRSFTLGLRVITPISRTMLVRGDRINGSEINPSNPMKLTCRVYRPMGSSVSSNAPVSSAN